MDIYVNLETLIKQISELIEKDPEQFELKCGVSKNKISSDKKLKEQLEIYEELEINEEK